MALLALQSNANQILSFNIRNDEYLPSTALPVFRSPEHATEFSDSVLKIADTRSFLWTVSVCRNTNEATFHTSIRRKALVKTEWPPSVRSKKFDVNDEWLVDELMFRQIGCIVIDTFNLQKDQLIVDGALWIPNRS